MPMQCSIDKETFTLTVNVGAAKIASLVVMVGILGGIFITMWMKKRHQSDGGEPTEKEGRNLDDFIGKDVDDLIDTIVPHLLVHQRLYKRHKKLYGEEFDNHITCVDIVIGRISAALGPACEEQ